MSVLDARVRRILATVAQDKERMIPACTNAALTAARALGIGLGDLHLQPGTREQTLARLIRGMPGIRWRM